MFAGRCVSVVAVALTMACGSAEQFFLPEGEVAAGKQVFAEYQCFACHEVRGEDYPEPSAITPIFVPLGKTGTVKSRYYLSESIIAPSHQFAVPRPPDGTLVRDESVKSGNRSRMTDFSDRLTVKQLVDLVAYLDSIQQN